MVGAGKSRPFIVIIVLKNGCFIKGLASPYHSCLIKQDEAINVRTPSIWTPSSILRSFPGHQQIVLPKQIETFLQPTSIEQVRHQASLHHLRNDTLFNLHHQCLIFPRSGSHQHPQATLKDEPGSIFAEFWLE